MVQYRLALTTHTDAPCIIIEYQGETGERATIIFESTDHLEAAAVSHTMALDCLREAEEIGYEAAKDKFSAMLEDYNAVTGLKTAIPDDISSLDANEENE